MPSPLLMRRSACCESLPQTLRSAEYPRRRALPGPVRRVRSSLLMTAPAPVRRMKTQDRSRSFSASPSSPPCPRSAGRERPALQVKDTLQATRLRYATSMGPIRPACPIVANRVRLRRTRPLARAVDPLPLTGRNTWRLPVSPCGSSGTRRRRAWQHLCCLEHDA